MRDETDAAVCSWSTLTQPHFGGEKRRDLVGPHQLPPSLGRHKQIRTRVVSLLGWGEERSQVSLSITKLHGNNPLTRSAM